MNAPKKSTVWISVIIAIVAVVGKWIVTNIPVISEYAYIVLLVGFVVLLLGSLLKGF